jgi:hypothetical protein
MVNQDPSFLKKMKPFLLTVGRDRRLLLPVFKHLETLKPDNTDYPSGQADGQVKRV